MPSLAKRVAGRLQWPDRLVVAPIGNGGRCRVGNIVIFGVLGAARRGSGATEAADQIFVATAIAIGCDL
jgi:hypothetical protein